MRMFDFAFSELALIGVVALVVIGPERLPRVARTAGVVVGRLQRYAASVKADIAREVELSELRRVQGEIKDAAQSFETSMRETIAGAESQLQQGRAAVMQGPPPSGQLVIAHDPDAPGMPAGLAAADPAPQHSVSVGATSAATRGPVQVRPPAQASLFSADQAPPGESAPPLAGAAASAQPAPFATGSGPAPDDPSQAHPA